MESTRDELVQHINNQVRGGDDIDHTIYETVQLIISHMHEMKEIDNECIPRLFKGITQIYSGDQDQQNAIIDLGRKATYFIISEILTLRHKQGITIGRWIYENWGDAASLWEQYERTDGRDLTGPQAMLDWPIDSHCGKAIIAAIQQGQDHHTIHQLHIFCSQEIAYG